MSKAQKISLLLLRISLGWLFLYSGAIKVFDPRWSALQYIQEAKNMEWLYRLFANPAVLPTVNFLNAWGQLLLGISLILGIGMWLSVRLGVVLMALYYLPLLQFPMVGRSFLIDEHVIYSLGLLVLLIFEADKAWGLKGYLEKKRLVKKSFVARLI